jgi:hypothetical protein
MKNEYSNITDEGLIEKYKDNGYKLKGEGIPIAVELTNRGYALKGKKEWIKRV